MKPFYNEVKHDYPDHQEIFTDGFKSLNKVSAAAIFLNSEVTFSTNLHLCQASLRHNLQP